MRAIVRDSKGRFSKTGGSRSAKRTLSKDEAATKSLQRELKKLESSYRSKAVGSTAAGRKAGNKATEVKSFRKELVVAIQTRDYSSPRDLKEGAFERWQSRRGKISAPASTGYKTTTTKSKVSASDRAKSQGAAQSLKIARRIASKFK